MSSVLEALKKAERERRDVVSQSILGVTATRAVPKGSRDVDWRTVSWVALIMMNVSLGAWLVWGGITINALPPDSRGQIIAAPAESLLYNQEVAAIASPAATDVPTTVSRLEPPSPATSGAGTGLNPVELDLPRAPVSATLDSNEIAIYSGGDEEESFDELAEPVAAIPEVPESKSDSPEPYLGDEFKSRKLGAHIFSDTPSRRMVMLDGRAFRQGDRMPNGWVLLEIGREQLVVERLDRRYSVWLSDIR